MVLSTPLELVNETVISTCSQRLDRSLGQLSHVDTTPVPSMVQSIFRRSLYIANTEREVAASLTEVRQDQQGQVQQLQYSASCAQRRGGTTAGVEVINE